jgi:hypothetical protein
MKEQIEKIIKKLLWPFFIRSKLIRMIKITTSERETFKNALKWNDSVSKEDEKYLESRIEIKNEVLYQLRNLL